MLKCLSHHSVQLMLFSSAELKSGPGSRYDEKDVLPEFARRELADNGLSREELRAVDTPKWFKTLFLSGATSQEIINHLLRRIRRAPSHKMHLLVELAINELSEYEDGTRVLEETVTESLLKELESITNEEVTY